MIVNISGYRFVSLQNLETWQASLRNLCASFNLKGTIVVSEEGVNIMLAGTQDSIDGWIKCFHDISEFSALEFKFSQSESIPFKRLLIKIKAVLVPGDVNPSVDTAPNITPTELHRWYQEGRDFTIIDTRNDYELEVGKFKNALDIHLHEFKDFPEKIAGLDPSIKDKPVVVYCTGGIRCEKAAPLALQAGFKEVYQLEGGILKYFETCGSDFFEGDCFVFDERSALNPKLDEAQG